MLHQGKLEYPDSGIHECGALPGRVGARTNACALPGRLDAKPMKSKICFTQGTAELQSDCFECRKACSSVLAEKRSLLPLLQIAVRGVGFRA